MIHDFGFGKNTFLVHWINSRISNYEEPPKQKKIKSGRQGFSKEAYEVSALKALTNFPLKNITDCLKIKRYKFYSRLSSSDKDFNELIKKHREDFVYNLILSLKDIICESRSCIRFQQGLDNNKKIESASAHEKKVIAEAAKIFADSHFYHNEIFTVFLHTAFTGDPLVTFERSEIFSLLKLCDSFFHSNKTLCSLVKKKYIARTLEQLTDQKTTPTPEEWFDIKQDLIDLYNIISADF